MNDRNGQNRRGTPKNAPSDIGVVRVFSKPGPDAEDRLRRLMSLMIRYATQDGQDSESASDDRPVDDSTDVEA